ncbi:Zn-dependent protease with chaperone function [Kibdelosporangium banguiense]|uniref:Zn-dependent protease with chaperone function n=1 Tax=Kibdelosporangium banguiense TaxID=1365924 RepID=A0ABS4THE6_9PSEU|nr:M48 family metallopeptidase [Kibdelosporangium banguiense]MBP2323862.1 Zn-dependent protease with chaperone function [Kibdelosporangium banguiense]
MTESDVQQSSPRVRFPGISPRAYEHPADKGAMATLRAVPGVADVLKTLNSLFNERAERLMAVASHVRVGPSQYPVLDRLRNEAAEVLDLQPVPKIYVARDPRAIAQTRGIDEPFIMLSTGLVEALDTEALRFVIGHEMGHVLSGHAVLLTLLDRLLRLQRSVAWVPLGVIGLRAVIAALYEWQRKSELSCDRAGLLVGQDPQAALRTHMYLAGATDLSQIDIPSFLEQAKEYEEIDDIRDSIIKLLAVEHQTHPFAVVRASQLQRWAASEEYRAILAGQYLRRDAQDTGNPLNEDIQGAAKSYKDSWNNSTDPLVKVFSDVGGALSGVADKVFSGFRRGGGQQTPEDEGGTNGGNGDTKK